MTDHLQPDPGLRRRSIRAKLLHTLGVVAVVALLGASGLGVQQAESRGGPVITGGGAVPRGLMSPTAVVPNTRKATERTSTRSGKGRRAVARDKAAAAVDPAWARRTARAADIPLPALTAYARASMLAPRGCRIGWTTLAGVGWIESQHGTLGDRRLRRDGQSSRPILGPALDGSGEFSAIEATRDSARWHGNRTWDHAVGPMQFIPSTWRTWQVDGDGDGSADPNDIDDAALAAARYLCQSGDLMVGETWARAILRYNNSTDYVLDVYTAADMYDDRTG
ncbi:lytic transglycosylase domain-containing protein [Nocardioides sp.]|uniref:lytic transglycosylase domain-containing protein n=1 Tax=Nocardioides sp. TaxID=35761 RepID=UPI002BA01D54|nr:lytic transglycosylase domain-containing protein [Nocardioides sp.]HXH77352.1 lytic transglycosylase domain-containing protein [Nocardioides sp.]